MAFEVQNDYVKMLQRTLPESLEIKAFYTAERSLTHIQNYPVVFVLNPNFNATSINFDYGRPTLLGMEYRVLIGVIHLEQDSEKLHSKMNSLMDALIQAVLNGHNDESFPYTVSRENFQGDFSPIFTQLSEQFMMDARLDFRTRKIRMEEIG